MAKLSIRNLNKIVSSIRKEIVKASRDKAIRTGIGMITVGEMRKLTFGPASPVTREFREYFEKYNKTHKTYNRSKLNSTFTGELLDDLKNNVKVKTTGGGIEYIVAHTNGTHKPYKRAKGSKKKTYKTLSKSGKTVNRQVRIPYKFISTQLTKRLGYDYFDLPSNAVNRIQKFFNKALVRAMRKSSKIRSKK